MATGSGWSAVVSSSSTAVINYPHQRSLLKELTASPASPECLPVTVPLSPLEPCLCVPRCLEPSSDSLCVPLLPSGDPFDTLDPWTRAWQLSWFQNLPRDAVEDTHWSPEFPDSPLRCFCKYLLDPTAGGRTTPLCSRCTRAYLSVLRRTPPFVPGPTKRPRPWTYSVTLQDSDPTTTNEPLLPVTVDSLDQTTFPHSDNCVP
ncbi:uncharacterized protein LOC116708024 isoform X1 [Xiphophorus hellerii]|uniref:uncharacterized protein LOC116708024 isoform X1 n=1 Tax=Xiphophorus hellerii TaxID=8084 RepID=UPI0013B3F978|nr:uncharacterized protein LOC116708024 isoform X1 [Xiphophorus hellerii]